MDVDIGVDTAGEEDEQNAKADDEKIGSTPLRIYINIDREYVYSTQYTVRYSPCTAHDSCWFVVWCNPKRRQSRII
jgi:hypothetical protein